MSFFFCAASELFDYFYVSLEIFASFYFFAPKWPLTILVALSYSLIKLIQFQAIDNIKMDQNIKKKIKLDDLPDLLTVREVADLLRVSILTIKRWGKRGKLTPIRINSRGDRRYKKEAVLWMLGMQGKE